MAISTEDRIKVIKNSLAEFQKTAEPVLDIVVDYFGRDQSLRTAIKHCHEALEVNWQDHHQGAVSDEIVTTFAMVAFNLPPLALKESIQWLHFATQDLILLQEQG